MRGRRRSSKLFALVTLILATLVPFGSGVGRAETVPAPPPLAKSTNVQVLGNIPISPAAGINFKGNYAYVTGWDGISVLDISAPASPSLAGFLPLPHFENEDVDLCGNTLMVTHDRLSASRGAFLYVIDISNRTAPSILSVLPLGDPTSSERGSGHIGNFVKSDCSLAWIDGGNRVEVISLKDRANPKSLGKFESAASLSKGFKVTHDTERDSKGVLWSTGGGGAAGYTLTSNPLKPRLRASTPSSAINRDFNEANSRYNDFIFHNSQRRGSTLLVTEEDYVDTEGGDNIPGGCRGQGKFQTWSIANFQPKGLRPLDTWRTELNAEIVNGSADSKAPATVNCSSHWFDTVGNIAAVGWYEQGTRFLDVSNPRKIRQVGFYLPANGSTWAAYWSPTDPSHQIVYTADVYRGVDVLKIKRSSLGPSAMKTVRAPIPQQWFETKVSYQESPVFSWFCPVFDLAA